jgi:DNA-binding CsgD family transcriptional regulator
MLESEQSCHVTSTAATRWVPLPQTNGWASHLNVPPRVVLSEGHRNGELMSTACLRAVLDQMDTGVVLCDDQGKVLLANEAARAELTDGGVFKLQQGGQLGLVGGKLTALLRAVHAAVAQGRRDLVPLNAVGRRLWVAVQPQPMPLGAAPCALLLLGRRQLCPELAVQMLGRQYELTFAERDVLVKLLDGATVAALAQARGVEVSTVRSQVAALRGKLGVRRIDDLIRMVAEMPSMVSALRSGAHADREPVVGNSASLKATEISSAMSFA